MKQILLMIAVVMGQTVLAADKKPLTKEESARHAKVIEEAIRISLRQSEGRQIRGELTNADLEKVTYLYLSYSKFTEVPKGMEKLTHLKELRLEQNELTDVKGLENLTQLTELSLSNNQLTNVKGLEKLTQLEVLSLNGNKLIEVPKELEKLTQLEELSLGANQLTNVKGLEKLTNLKRLSLYDNKLTDVKGLEKLTKLEVLSLDNNPALTKAQIAELKKALPNCKIYSNPKK